MSEAELFELRQEIAALSVHKNSRRYPGPLRANVARWARRRLAAGVAVACICAELDVSEPTLRRFLAGTKPPRSSPRRVRFSQLKVVEQEPKPASAVVLRGPRGVVVEGLSVDDLARLLRGLSCSA